MESILASLKSIRLSGGVFLDAEFSAPWCVSGQLSAEDCAPFGVQPAHLMEYHYVREGRLELHAEGSAPIVVEAGEIVILPHNTPHELGSTLQMSATPARSLAYEIRACGPTRLVYGGGGEKTLIFCGFLGSDTRENSLIAMLPKVMKLRVDDGAAGEWVASSFRFALEMSADRDHSAIVLSKVAELLFVEAVRRYVENLPESEQSWLGGLEDPAVAQSLALLHGEVSRHWTTDELASSVGFSRSAFAQRFTDLVGEPPMRYLARWRMQLAGQRLTESDECVATVANQCGYASEEAFTRAFKREYGLPPSAWRREQGRSITVAGSK